MVSRPTRGTTFLFTACSATRRTVQRAAPGGGALHTIAMMRCLSEGANTSAAPGRCASNTARVIPPATGLQGPSVLSTQLEWQGWSWHAPVYAHTALSGNYSGGRRPSVLPHKCASHGSADASRIAALRVVAYAGYAASSAPCAPGASAPT